MFLRQQNFLLLKAECLLAVLVDRPMRPSVKSCQLTCAHLCKGSKSSTRQFDMRREREICMTLSFSAGRKGSPRARPPIAIKLGVAGEKQDIYLIVVSLFLLSSLLRAPRNVQFLMSASPDVDISQQPTSSGRFIAALLADFFL